MPWAGFIHGNYIHAHTQIKKDRLLANSTPCLLSLFNHIFLLAFGVSWSLLLVISPQSTSYSCLWEYIFWYQLSLFNNVLRFRYTHQLYRVGIFSASARIFWHPSLFNNIFVSHCPSVFPLPSLHVHQFLRVSQSLSFCTASSQLLNRSMQKFKIKWSKYNVLLHHVTWIWHSVN